MAHQFFSMRRAGAIVLGAVLAFATGCIDGSGASSPADPTVNPNFDSDDPSASSSSTPGAADASASASDAAAPAANDRSTTEAERAIQEADIIQLRGTRLYALSRYGGLSIVDVSVRDRLRLLGRRRMNAIPFEMYVQNDVVYSMATSFGHVERDSATGADRWVQSSRITALDVRDPANIREIGAYDVPGEISDSRMVGSVLYLVSYEDGYCWHCATAPSTVVSSFAVGDPARIARVDQMAFTAPNQGYSWWRRSVTATHQRLYIAGPSWSWDGRSTPQSVVQIVDISDPRGALSRGADVPVEGQITSRWQMDEYMGVLRVVSQGGRFWGNSAIDPAVQTFRVTSSREVTPLGRTTLRLPQPESLRSVRFDGARGYAITAQQTDPLYTIDLSDPANPRQMGELVIPGWVYHMEPRGDRLIGLGFDQQNADGSLHVSLFDVSNLSAPRMIQRVNFARGWANVAEDQDRIHKSFQILDELGLILVPFASYGRWDGSSCVAPTSGIQLVDYTRDSLALRGVAPQQGQPRRAFIHDTRLFAVSDRNVATFNIGDRAAPAKTAELDLSTSAHRIVTTDAHVISLSNDWWSGEPTLEVFNRADADEGTSIGKVSLRALAPDTSGDCYGYSQWAAWYSASVRVSGSYAYVVVPPTYSYYFYDPRGSAPMARAPDTIVGVVDLRDPTHPQIVGRLAIPTNRAPGCAEGAGCGYGTLVNADDGAQYYYYGDVISGGTAVVQYGSTLAMLETGRVSSDWRDSSQTRTLRVVDLSNPARPALVASVNLGTALGATPLLLQGSVVYTSRWNAIPGAPGRVRYWIDRVDLATPAAPRVLPSVQVPGTLLAVDGARVVTVGYQRVTAAATSWQDCYSRVGVRAYFDSEANACVTVRRSFKLLDVSGSVATLRQTLDLPDASLSRVLTGDDRIFLGVQPEYNYMTGTPSRSAAVLVYSGVRAGRLALSSRVETTEYAGLMAARGTRIVIPRSRGVAVYDTANPASPSMLASVDLRGYGWASNVQLDADRATCALGEWGIQTISLR